MSHERDTAFDVDLLRRYDRPGPRYTSYPTAPQFGPDFNETAIREHTDAAMQSRFHANCRCICTFPTASAPVSTAAVIADHHARSQRGSRYVERLIREIGLVAPLFDRDRDVMQMHFGGGTPNFLRANELGELIESLQRHFHFAGRSIAIFRSSWIRASSMRAISRRMPGSASIAPASACRISIPTCSGRSIASKASSKHAMRSMPAVAYRFRSVNVDLIYGLPQQTLEGFGKTLDTVIEAGRTASRSTATRTCRRCSSLSDRSKRPICRMPSSEACSVPSADREANGGWLRYIGMDHFALPSDDLARAQERHLQRNFMGYTTHARVRPARLGRERDQSHRR